MGFPRQEYWRGFLLPSPRDLPNPGIKLSSPALAGRFFASEPPGNPDRLVTIPLFVHYPPAPSPFSLSVSLSCVVSLVLSLTHGPIHTFLIRWLCFGRGWRSGEQLLEVRNPRGWPWPCCSGISNLQQLFPPPPASSETQPLDKKSSARF